MNGSIRGGLISGDEALVAEAFCGWLRADGWEVRTEVAYADVRATRDGTTLV